MIFLPVLAYAEIHYRFKYFFSLLKTKEPEIVFDAPHRVEPGTELPILLFVKDAHLFPIEIISVEIALQDNSESINYNYFVNEWVNEQFWDRIIRIPFENNFQNKFGNFNIYASVCYSINGKIKTCLTDSYKFKSKNPLSVYRSKYKLPRFENSIYGDLHTHSNFTNDQVEFGAPLSASTELCRSMGIDFFCATDHSYDLDDEPLNYLKNDPLQTKWKSFLKETERINQSNSNFKIINGEELSCQNNFGKNIHLLLLNERTLLIGSGDSAEKWLQTKSQHTSNEAIIIKDSNALAIAAHPFEEVPFLQKILFNRGSWTTADLENPNLSGVQILNGVLNKSFEIGKIYWISEILKGRKLFIFGGTDAHGNFNSYRQIKIPFLKVEEKQKFQLFGSMRTLVFSETLETNSIIENLKIGNCIITTGPIAKISISENKFLNIKVLSTPEFGNIKYLQIFLGNIGSEKELLYYNENFKTTSFQFENKIEIPLKGEFYFRCEVNCTNGEGIFPKTICLTNPIWFKN